MGSTITDELRDSLVAATLLADSVEKLLSDLGRIRSVLGLPEEDYPADTRNILSACRGLVDLAAEVSAYLSDPEHPGERALAEALERCQVGP